MADLDDDDAGDDERDQPSDDQPSGPRPDPSDRPWVHPAELQSFVAAPVTPAEPPRPREWLIGVVSGLVGVAATILLLVAFGALGDRNRSAVPPPVVTAPNSPIDYSLGRQVAAQAAPVIVTVTINPPATTTGGAGASQAVAAQTPSTQGSGVVLRTNRVVTSAHLVDGASTVKVSTSDGSVYDAQVIGVDPATDLCVLEVDGVGDELPDPELTATAEIGEPVIAVAAGRGNTAWISMGVVQERNWLTSNGNVAVAGLLATSTDTTPTTTGGGLFDSNGRLIGILTTTPGTSRSGLAVTIDVALDVANQLERSKSVNHGGLGVLFGADVKTGSGGALVAAVSGDGPAAKANPPLQPGDVVTRAGDDSIHGMADLIAESRRRRPNDPIELVFQRNGRTQRTVVTLGTANPGLDTEHGPLG